MHGEPITSRHNQRVKDVAKLREHRQRARQGRFLIDGARELARAFDAGVPLDEVFVCRELCKSEAAQDVLARLPDTGVMVTDVAPEVFEKLAFGERAEGVLGVAHTPQRTLDELRLPADSLVAVVEGIEKPGNLGAMLRSADGAGVAAVIVVDGQTDLYNPNTIRASLGTIFTVPVCEATSAAALAWLRSHGYRMIASRPDATRSYVEIDYRGPLAIILGSEAQGLSAAWTANDVTPVALPMHGIADSLNVAMTASVLFYEARRQRALNDEA